MTRVLKTSIPQNGILCYHQLLVDLLLQASEPLTKISILFEADFLWGKFDSLPSQVTDIPEESYRLEDIVRYLLLLPLLEH